MNADVETRTTTYGGRGVFAKVPIAKGVLLHTCESPYASVIYREFRKEVCAECFAYAFDAGRNTWNVKIESVAWFCGETCRDRWMMEENRSGLLVDVEVAIRKAVERLKKIRFAEVVTSQVAVGTAEITVEAVDLAWERALNGNRGTRRSAVFLDKMEVEIARYVASAIVTCYLEDIHPVRSIQERSTWSDFKDLQNNEFPHVLSRPYILDIHLRMYAFLRSVLPPQFQAYLSSPDMVRAVLARDPGNSFGVWQIPSAPESEMFGWGVYVSASYFNHNCSPNVRKERAGRALRFYTARDVSSGEELCICYVDGDDTVMERRSKLKDRWYFDCACDRCQRDLSSLQDS